MADKRLPAAHDPLTRAWDDVVRRRPARPYPNLDPALIEVVRRFHALDDAPAPDRDFARHLREELMAPAETPQPIALREERRRDGTRARAAMRRSPTVGHLASAALVAITLVAGFAVGWILRPNGDTPRAAPVVVATPFVRAEPAIDPLVGATTDRLPTAFSWTGIDRITVRPGGSEAPFAWTGERLVVVEAGRIGVRAEAPVFVGREGGQTMAPESNPTLGAGDVAVVPANLVHAIFNASGPEDLMPQSDAVIVDALVIDATLSGVSGIGVEAVVMASVSGGPVPPAPARIALGRAVLDPGQTLEAPADGVLQVVGPLPADDGIVRTSGDGTARNTGDRPATVYVLTVTRVLEEGDRGS